MPEELESVPKISLFDIFLGTSRTIRRPTGFPGLPLLQTSPLAIEPPQTPTPAEAEKALDKKEVSKDGGKPKKMKGDGKNAADTPAFTPEQDAQLLSLKDENKPWKVIAEQLDRPAWQLKARFKDLKSREGADGTNAKDDKGKTAENDTKKSKKNNTKRDEKQEINEKKRERLQKHITYYKHNEATPPPASLVDSKVSSWLELQEDDLFSYDELLELVQILDQDVKRTWDRVASTFYNRTGRRVLPSDVREKLRESSVSSIW